MKSLVLIIICMLVTISVAFAEVAFHNDKTPTLGWEAVTTDIDGDLITGVTYRLHLANANTDPDKLNPVVVADEDGNNADLQASITLVKGRFFVGIQAVLSDLVSEINWGDEIPNQENVQLFGLRWAVPPHAPKKIVK